MGHEEPPPPLGLRDRFGFSQQTFAEAHANDGNAPLADSDSDLRCAIEPALGDVALLCATSAGKASLRMSVDR